MQIKIEVTFPKELKNEPLICNICKQFDIVLNIVEASFSTDIGWAILILHGEEETLNLTSKYLINQGANLKILESKTS